MSGRFPAKRLGSFAEQIASANVVFFIGAGFSIDSEGNTTNRLLRRLLARFYGLCDAIAPRGIMPQFHDTVDTLRDGFQRFHGIQYSPKHPEFFQELGRRYYEFNDWCVSAFGTIGNALCRIHARAKLADVERAIAHAEAMWLDALGSQRITCHSLEPFEPDSVPLLPVDIMFLKRVARSDRGKMLFLEAMGFACPAVMGGCIEHANRVDVATSYGSRLLARHQVLARLAREGLTPVLLTTNFDILLEGAYRLAGLEEWDRKDASPKCPAVPTRHPYFARIAGVSDYVKKRDGGRVSSIVKIHGCADSFRTARIDPVTTLEATLRSIVFTYREVQNWRQDAWTRDLVYTLLRTRSIAFLGYSTADPVLHDTVRNAYEEMSQRCNGRAVASAAHQDAPAFFFSPNGTQEFHGMEVLRAASRAVGAPDPRQTEHPNHLTFHFRGKPNFPDIDELLAWTFHGVFRRRQHQAAQAELGSVATLLLGHPVPHVEVEALIEDLNRLWTAEQATASCWAAPSGNPGQDRAACARAVGWTRNFHPRLLRDFAIAHRVASHGTLPTTLASLRDGHWYYPANENFGWTAWAAVVELAIRRLVAHLAGQPAEWAVLGLDGTAPPILAPVDHGDEAAFAISGGSTSPLPMELSIRVARFGRAGKRPVGHALYWRRAEWTLDLTKLPWSPSGFGTPSPEDLWQWALGRFAKTSRTAVHDYFGRRP